MGFIGVTFGLAIPMAASTGPSVIGLTDGYAVIGQILNVLSAGDTPSWRSPTSTAADEIGSGDTWVASGADEAPLYLVVGSVTLGPYTLRNRVSLSGWNLTLGATLSVGKVVNLGLTDAQVLVTIGGIQTPFSGTELPLISGEGAQITITQRNLPSNELVLGPIAACPPLEITTFPSIGGNQGIGEDVTVAQDEQISWDDVAVSAISRQARLLIDGTAQTAGNLTLPNNAGGQTCDVQVRFTYATATGLEITTPWTTIPGESFSIIDTTPPIPLELTVDGLELTISAGPGDTTITVIAPAAFAGSYMIDTADLATGPVNLVPTTVTDDGSPDAGETVTATPGLWIYDGDVTEPVITTQWLRNGTPISGATGLSYDLSAADAGATVTLRETATDANGTRSADSAPITVAGGALNWTAPSIIGTDAGSVTLSSSANTPATPSAPIIDSVGDGSVTLKTA